MRYEGNSDRGWEESTAFSTSPQNFTGHEALLAVWLGLCLDFRQRSATVRSSEAGSASEEPVAALIVGHLSRPSQGLHNDLICN